MQHNARILLLTLMIFLMQQVNSQVPDTLTLAPNNFRDSAALRKLIDTAFKYKEDEPFNALKVSHYAYNRSVELKNRNLQAGALNLRGSVYSDLRDHASGLRFLYEALRLFESTDNKHGIAMSYSNIGRVYSESGKPNEAITYLTKGEKISKEYNLHSVLLHIYLNYANNYITINKLDTALSYALKVDSLNHSLNVQKIRVSNNNTIGALYYFMADYDKALLYYNRSKEEALQIKDLTTHYQATINIGEVYEVTKKQDPLPYYLKPLEYFRQINNHGVAQYAANNIANYYKTKGNYQAAFNYYQQSVAAGDKNRNKEVARNMTLIQTQYETEKKEQQISLLNQENTIQRLSIAGRNKTIAIISGIFILSVIIMFLLYKRYKYKQRMILQEQIMNQREVLTKAVIDAEEKERKRIASDLHDGVGQLFSAVKLNLTGLISRITMERDEDRFLAEKTIALVDESCKEVRQISHQMMPNTLLRSGIASDVRNFIEKIDSENLKVRLEANGFKNRIESNAEIVLYRVIQESVNNVIKHSRASQLDILLNRDETGISVVIADNGIGFNTSLLDDFEGIGLKNIRARIEYLKGTVRYDSVPGKGTTVNIWVPL